MREIDTIVVHCSATKPSMDIGADKIREWHRGNGWSDIGYHFVIRRNGNIENGRMVEIPGAHAKGYNQKSIGICMVGGINEKGDADANFTLHQYLALTELLNDLDKQFPSCQLLGHRDISDKACPSFDVQSFRENGLNR